MSEVKIYQHLQKNIFASFFKLLWSVINSNCHLFTYVCEFTKSVYKDDSR